MPTDLADPAAAAKRSDAAVALYAAKAAERTLLGGITTARDVGGWNYVEMAGAPPLPMACATGRACFSRDGCFRSPPARPTTTLACTRSPTAPRKYARPRASSWPWAPTSSR
ncbi:MAG: hypothetical protein ACREE7_10520 [Dongiaceae bacterium]